MRPPLRRLAFAVMLLPLVALLPACGGKNSGKAGSGTEPPPPGPSGGSGDDRAPTRPDAGTTADGPSPPVLFAGAQGPRHAAARMNSSNNLKQILIAFHNVTDTYGGGLPLGVYDASGKKVGLSWRVAILPFIEQDQLYKQFKLDEPWDSPANKKLIDKMPKTFAVQGQETADGKTYYRAVTGAGTVFPPPAGGKPGSLAFGLKFQNITDGTSNTLAVVEARDPVIWTKPDELVYEAGNPVPKVGGVFEAGFNAAFCDASVRFIPKTTDEKTLRAMMTASGGEVFQMP